MKFETLLVVLFAIGSFVMILPFLKGIARCRLVPTASTIRRPWK
jgi:hypothetical protein